MTVTRPAHRSEFEYVTDIRDHLRTEVSAFETLSDLNGEVFRPPGYKYANTADIVADLGVEYVGRELPARFHRGPQGQCFANAARLAQNCPDLTYVEGFGSSLFPIHHAWCIDEDGAVIDTTWEDLEARRYLGIPIPTDTLWSILEETGLFGVLGCGFGTEHRIDAIFRTGVIL